MNRFLLPNEFAITADEMTTILEANTLPQDPEIARQFFQLDRIIERMIKVGEIMWAVSSRRVRELEEKLS